jgi:hypothetical protein
MVFTERPYITGNVLLVYFFCVYIYQKHRTMGAIEHTATSYVRPGTVSNIGNGSRDYHIVMGTS